MSAAATTLAIDRDMVRMYVYLAQRAGSDAEILDRLYTARKAESREKDALWSGHWAVRLEFEKLVRELRDCGGLLHFRRVRMDQRVAARDFRLEYVALGAAA
jgi:hypothetical protein